MDYDYSKLRGRIVEKYGSIRAFTEKTSLSNVSVSKKINGLVGFSQADIEQWSDLLEIPIEDIGLYYFVKKVN